MNYPVTRVRSPQTFENGMNPNTTSKFLPCSKPELVGILNITQDSFSDGGRYFTQTAAEAQALNLHRDGASFVELGPASSHPDAGVVSAEEEIQRISPLLPFLASNNIRFGLDSFQPKTQIYAAEHGAAFINDTRGFPDPKIYTRLAEHTCSLVIMHAMQAEGKADRGRHSRAEVWTHLLDFLERRIESLTDAGIAKERLILDPGMGFFLSADPNPSLSILTRIPELINRFECPLFISVSRKSFLRSIAEVAIEESDSASLAAELFSARQGVSYIRTHSPAALSAALRIEAALAREFAEHPFEPETPLKSQ